MIVVGAGPVGLTAALALRAAGLPATVIEAEPHDRVRPGSRALFVHRDSLQLLRGLDPELAAELSAYGLVWPTRRTLYRGREIFARTYPPRAPGAAPPFVSLRQVDTERFLLRACERAGVAFAWDAPVVSVRAQADGVAVADAGGRAWSAEYAIGADGARSAVRRSLGIAMRGPRAEGFHVVVDLAEDAADPLPVERVFHYEHPAMGGRNVLLVPFAGGWQVDLQCRTDDAPDAFTGADALCGWLPKVLPAKYAQRVLWVSTYRFMQVVAESFADRERRVLLAGEAAHLFAPFGARGMNSGIADACAAAGALARAVADPARAHAEIASYERERRAAAEYNRDAARAALAHMRASSALARAKRRVAAALAPRFERFGAWLESGPYGPRGSARPGAASRY